MKKSEIKLILTLLLFFQLNIVEGQTQKGVLSKGESVSSEIASGEKHQYKVKLEKDQFAFFKLMQKGVDMKITTYDLKGDKIEELDSPNGKNGPELFTII